MRSLNRESFLGETSNIALIVTVLFLVLPVLYFGGLYLLTR
jgi:hypothetical protein